MSATPTPSSPGALHRAFLAIKPSLSPRRLSRFWRLALAPRSPRRPSPTRRSPSGTVDMATVLQPGPLPELVMGDPKGVTVVEYGSLTCPHCAAFERDVFPKLKANYIDNGKVKFIFREFSRNPLDVAAFIARALRRRRQGAGDDRSPVRAAGQMGVRRKSARALIAAVRPTGLSHDAAMACLKDQSKAEAMQKIVKTAIDVVKVQGTPTFVIDGKVYGGELTLGRLRRDPARRSSTNKRGSPLQEPSPGQRAARRPRSASPADTSSRQTAANRRGSSRRRSSRRCPPPRRPRARRSASDSEARLRAAPRSARRAARSPAAGSSTGNAASWSPSQPRRPKLARHHHQFDDHRAQQQNQGNARARPAARPAPPRAAKAVRHSSAEGSRNASVTTNLKSKRNVCAAAENIRRETRTSRSTARG